MKGKKKPKTKATDPTIEARVQEIVQIRLDGAESWDIRQYIAEKEKAGEFPWKLADGAEPMCVRNISRYIAKADDAIAQSSSTTRRAALRKHLAQRRSLYARAVQAGDLRTALAIKDSEAALLDIFPAKRVKTEHSGNIGHTYDGLSDEELQAEVERLKKLREGAAGAGSPASAK